MMSEIGRPLPGAGGEGGAKTSASTPSTVLIRAWMSCWISAWLRSRSAQSFRAQTTNPELVWPPRPTMEKRERTSSRSVVAASIWLA
jgi:hypothetical protein